VASQVLNFEAGQNVILPLDPNRRAKNYTVASELSKLSEQGPSKQRLSPPVTSDALVIDSPQVGQWTVTGDGAEAAAARMGFSVNVPITETAYVPLETADLDALFGKGGYKLAGDAETLRKNVGIIRVGVEIFPWLMALILILVTLENLLANKFYRESAPQPALGAAA
jgi:hypothetical protein